MFTDNFKLTENSDNQISILSEYTTDELWKDIPAGSYNDGLLIICDKEKYGVHTLEEWSHLVGEEALPVAITAWGDVFCVSFTQKRFLFLFSQENQVTDLGQSIVPFFDNLLTDEGLRSSLLDYDRYSIIREELGPLPYGSCYILKPYQILGGDQTQPKNYTIGDNEIYLSLVAQTHAQI